MSVTLLSTNQQHAPAAHSSFTPHARVYAKTTAAMSVFKRSAQKLMKLKGTLCDFNKKIVKVTGMVSLGLLLGYTLLFTATPVYVLDRLELRPLILPDISCQNCNNFTVSYMIENTKLCADQDVFLMILVISYHANADARHAIRSSWGGLREYRGKQIRTLFTFGVHNDKNFNKQLLYEQAEHGDVLQGSFRDNYRSLTNKTMMTLQWLAKHCSSARFILKTDDDSFNVPQRFIDYLLTVTEPQFVGGYCLTIMPDRRVSSKYYVSKDVYPDQFYPTYCAGPGYILSRASLTQIVAVADNVQYLPMEDVYVAGMCRHAAGIKYTQIPGVIVSTDQMSKCGLATWAKNAHNVVPGRALTLWQKVVDSDKDLDCVGINTGIFIVFLVFLVLWVRILWRIFGQK